MNQHGHKADQPSDDAGAPLHHDWRLWAVVGVMLFAMAIYVLTLNEMISFGGTTPPPPAPPAAMP